MERVIIKGKKAPGGAEHVVLHSIKALHEIGFKVFFYLTAYPKREETLKRIGIDVTGYIGSFVQTIDKEKRLPFLGIYKSIVDTYFSYNKFQTSTSLCSNNYWWCHYAENHIANKALSISTL
jgi:hypothetical protein